MVIKNDNVVLIYLCGKILWFIEWEKKKSVQKRGRDAHRKSNREELYQNAVIFHNGNSIYHWATG